LRIGEHLSAVCLLVQPRSSLGPGFGRQGFWFAHTPPRLQGMSEIAAPTRPYVHDRVEFGCSRCGALGLDHCRTLGNRGRRLRRWRRAPPRAERGLESRAVAHPLLLTWERRSRRSRCWGTASRASQEAPALIDLRARAPASPRSMSWASETASQPSPLSDGSAQMSVT
jgi:hypothetical protein